MSSSGLCGLEANFLFGVVVIVVVQVEILLDRPVAELVEQHEVSIVAVDGREDGVDLLLFHVDAEL